MMGVRLQETRIYQEAKQEGIEQEREQSSAGTTADCSSTPSPGLPAIETTTIASQGTFA